MAEEILKKRERGLEQEWAAKHDQELIERLRAKDTLESIAKALAAKLQTDDPALVQRAIGLGVTPENAAAVLLLPLVQTAWMVGDVTGKEKAKVLRLAQERGVSPDSPTWYQLVEWLEQRPSDELFHVAIDVIKAGIGVLTPAEQQERVATLARGCREVAEVSGNLWHKLGFTSGVSPEEASFLELLKAKLREA